MPLPFTNSTCLASPPILHPKYENQVVFSFKGNGPDEVIVEKITKKHKYIYKHGTTIINARYYHNSNFIIDPREIHACQGLITPKTRIYIDAHGSAGSAFISSNPVIFGQETKKFGKSAAEIAQFIAQYIPPVFKMEPQKYKFKISLLSCEGGMPSNHNEFGECVNNSFASQLLYELKLRNIDSAIAARLGILFTYPGQQAYLPVGQPMYEAQSTSASEFSNRLQSRLIKNQQGLEAARELGDTDGMQVHQEYAAALQNRYNLTIEKLVQCFYPSHSNEAKVIYEYKDGRQVMTRAYQEPDITSRDIALEVLQECIQLSKSEQERELLQEVLNLQVLINWNERSFCGFIKNLVEIKPSKITTSACYKKLTHLVQRARLAA